ncbi:ABC transporter ATP-binding protein [Variovorax sp. YR216]|uniref:ABC transporter ATP-binding protein n=1 Tax=Variovorax sp. YR216 TaxID=1882828 RepID=UPI0008961A06|nr:ABC transporter ATP-binding protein [Variovorax sp. YR216]SEB01326.1 amino acid/amide ABC transporter ATP-binding protein 2, HAAT family [Variovorax sp. YR216]
MSSNPILEVDRLVTGYGATRVVHGLSLQVREGGVTALLGANGAGKTTLMKTLCGLLPVQGGALRFMGEEIGHRTADKRVLSGLVLVPEGRMVFPTLSVHENLRLGGINLRARPRLRQNIDRVFDIFPRLRERSSQAAATLSGGEQQMLAIGRGLMAEPKLMLLDEPTLGLAPVMALEIFALVRRLTAEGLTLLLAEQDVHRTLEVATHAYVVENGRVAAEGPAAEIAGDPRIRQAYLGL